MRPYVRMTVCRYRKGKERTDYHDIELEAALEELVLDLAGDRVEADVRVELGNVVAHR